MVEIECLACRKSFKPQQLNDTENYNTDNYDGQIVCQECNSLLHVKLVKEKVHKYKIVENKSKSFNWVELVKSAEEYEKRQKKEEH